MSATLPSPNAAKRFDVVGTGSMVVDSIHRVPRFAGPDAKVLLGLDGQPALERFVGGVTLNHLGWASLLGARVAIFGKQADDENGRFLRAGMARLAIEAHIDRSGSASSFASIFVDRDGERAIYMARGATAEFAPDEVDAVHGETIDAARIVTSEVSQLPLATVQRVLERARAAGAITLLDLDVPLADAVPALGTRDELDACLALARWLKPSLGALESLVAAAAPEAMAEELADRSGAEAVALTLGGEGALVWTRDGVDRVGVAAIQVVDSTGAGDAFLGGLIASRVSGGSWSEALRLGGACGAACCERLGAFPDASAELLERVRTHLVALGGDADAILSSAPTRAPTPSEDALADFLRIAPEQLAGVASRLDPKHLRAAADAIDSAAGAGGRLHLMGVGKAGDVARYAAGLLSSVGTPATLLDALDAVHGSSGQVRRGDVVLAISHSGETVELLRALETVAALGARVLAICGSAASPLARMAEVVLPASVEREGGPLDLAPRASVLGQALVAGALSVELQQRRNFARSDFAARHPSGSLGGRARD